MDPLPQTEEEWVFHGVLRRDPISTFKLSGGGQVGLALSQSRPLFFPTPGAPHFPTPEIPPAPRLVQEGGLTCSSLVSRSAPSLSSLPQGQEDLL